jgi:hypothetical protein
MTQDQSRIKAIEDRAREELDVEAFHQAVDLRKQELRESSRLPWYKRLFPFRIKIERI